MPLKTAIAFFALNSAENDHSKDKLISSQQLNENTWLYVTGETGGGATVADSYRYYLAGKSRVISVRIWRNRFRFWSRQAVRLL